MKKFNIFIACDTIKISKINRIINATKKSDFNLGYKFGLEFINSVNGRKYISKLKKKIVFLDLKLNDIPNTVSATMDAIKDLNINYVTVHVSSGLNALKACKKNAGKTKVIGVTILTSLDNNLIKQIGYNKKLKNLVAHQARLAKKAGLDGLVCSPHEVAIVRKYFKKEIITPGIRLNGKSDDQKRIMTPKQAFDKGSDWIVIGRSITKGNIIKNFKELTYHLRQI